MVRSLTEAEIQAGVFLDVGALPDVRLFRNNTGQGWQGDVKRLTNGAVLITNARPVNFGLCKGSSDAIGWRTLTITPGMVGRRVAVFAALELKTRTGRPDSDQERFLAAVATAGGLAGVVRSPDMARTVLQVD